MLTFYRFIYVFLGNTLRLNSDLVLSRIGATAMDTVNEYRLLSWLGMQEDIHRMVIYQVRGI